MATGLSDANDSPWARRWQRGAPGRAWEAPTSILRWCSPAGHLADPEAMLAVVHDELAPAALVGCGAGGVLGGAAGELEVGTGVAVWAAALEGGEAHPFHATVPARGRGRRPGGDARARLRRGGDHAV